MKKLFAFMGSICFIAFLCDPVQAARPLSANQPDSVYLFAYATNKNFNRNGLHFAWSKDKTKWFCLGPEHSYLRCDYGRWGAEKRMITPFIIQSPDGWWHCIWSLNEKDGTFAHAASKDLIHWKRQSYPVMAQGKNCLQPEIAYRHETGEYTITWISSSEPAGSTRYSTTTLDFKNYTPAKSCSGSSNKRETFVLTDTPETGTVHKVAWETVENLINEYQLVAYKNQLFNEQAADDPVRFAWLKPLHATLLVDTRQSFPISQHLFGVFFEDISYAADGGLYAELVQNRDFEYDPSDKEGNDKTWNSYKAWSLTGNQMSFHIDTVSPIHPHNPHYAVLDVASSGDGLANEGFDGIVLKAGEKYNASLFARLLNGGKKGKLTVRLTGKNGEVYGTAITRPISSKWEKYTVSFTALQDAVDARLEVVPQFTGKIGLDMISLFPQKTFKGRTNGLRPDIAQTIADLHPRFVRFPGGCVAHGDGLGNIYRWKNTIGPLEARKPQRNLWGYHQTAGLGYFEFFQFCEDIKAEPLPVIAAGVPCQNSGTGGSGQQGGIPMCDMPQYIQDILDLIEYANGDVKTTWGKKRAEAGHPQPFNLKYIGIGNEDLITDIFEERFTMIFNALKEKHPEITVIGTVGPFCEGTDYEEGWEIATKLGVPIVDEHYYQTPGWFIYNQDFYDKYDRNKSKVYLGEYAAHLPGRPNNLETALAEALYLTSVERNGDVVEMTSYAPLLAKEGHTHWNPDLIYFNNREVKPTVGYYVQQLYGQNAGNEYLPGKSSLAGNNNPAVQRRFATSVVRDTLNQVVIVKLVNLLPVSIQTDVKLDGLTNLASTGSRTVLTGEISSKTAKPVSDSIPVGPEFSCSLPAYSFTVIRIKINS
ncbi:alpha-L-arabinofuranosidase C-terminal domain-containing protein [Parabacteroides pacaensis]|uniref:alpha-L-arabinofuranosidase C-terminal domain-containing protein n=1 Tax=Parabacteroides pacaensis TaxID=2086575 RepID=UPI001F175715|nr:alpha-L-arabinofuranosidase C-terminal domain-containing protein [Parabacteroides pacaensis]